MTTLLLLLKQQCEHLLLLLFLLLVVPSCQLDYIGLFFHLAEKDRHWLALAKATDTFRMHRKHRGWRGRVKDTARQQQQQHLFELLSSRLLLQLLLSSLRGVAQAAAGKKRQKEIHSAVVKHHHFQEVDVAEELEQLVQRHSLKRQRQQQDHRRLE